MADYERYPRHRRDWSESDSARRYGRGREDRTGRLWAEEQRYGDTGYGGRDDDEEFRGYAEDRSFQSSPNYGPDYRDRGRERMTRQGAAGRYGEYRGSDYRGVRPRAADIRDHDYNYDVYGEYQSYLFNPYDASWGFSPGLGFGRDLTGGYGRDRDRDHRQRHERHGRGFWDRAGDEVASWFGDDEAQARRERDRGEHSGRGPKGYKRSDSRINEDVSDRLTHDSWINASDIEVRVQDGEVTLDGTVDSREAKRRAERIAEEVMGVGHVQNNLRVTRGMDGDYASDPNASPTLKASGEAIIRGRGGIA